jgi:hypothetical protein
MVLCMNNKDQNLEDKAKSLVSGNNFLNRISPFGGICISAGIFFGGDYLINGNSNDLKSALLYGAIGSLFQIVRLYKTRDFYELKIEKRGRDEKEKLSS